MDRRLDFKENMIVGSYLSLFIVYFVWWAWNSCIFQNKFIPEEVTVG
jgi:hypothetical protein